MVPIRDGKGIEVRNLKPQVVRTQQATGEQFSLPSQVLYTTGKRLGRRRIKERLPLQPKLVSAPPQRRLQCPNLTQIKRDRTTEQRHGETTEGPRCEYPWTSGTGVPILDKPPSQAGVQVLNQELRREPSVAYAQNEKAIRGDQRNVRFCRDSACHDRNRKGELRLHDPRR
jgi:hypothetical protein